MSGMFATDRQPVAMMQNLLENFSPALVSTIQRPLTSSKIVLATRVSNWRTVVGLLGSFALLGFVLHATQPGTFRPVGFNLLAGGLLFGAFFMATDPVTSPITNVGKWIYGILIGVLTLLIRHLTAYVEGMMFAIPLGNIAAPLLDEIVFRSRFRRLHNER